ncbi:MAG: hypothetical protein KKA55_05985 [Proteobacteria bacterium]|nr:hypothetical protein [Pseudomonadota bacterium]MBU1595069.1 hypothetical protein [Pseudomonadota bacterium]
MNTRLERELVACASPLEAHGQEWMRQYIFGPDFVGFDGHFPNRPVLPALVQLMAGSHCAVEACGEDTAPIGVTRAKFLRPVQPGQPITVRVRLTSKESAWLAFVTIDVLGEAVSTFQLSLTR